MSLPERLLWTRLRLRPENLKFRRQHPIGPYVVDFCCVANKCAVEIDGFSHDTGDRHSRDVARTRFLEENGFKVIRLSAQRVLSDVDGAAAAIVGLVATPHHRPADGPPPRPGEDF